MYQYFILLLLVSFLGTGAYYVNVTDDGKILSASFTSDTTESHEIYDEKQISGRYICVSSSGCLTPLELNLKETGEFSITPYTLAKSQNSNSTSTASASSSEMGLPIITEEGSWVLNEGGFVTLTVTTGNKESYEIPKVIVIQSVGGTVLSRLSYPQSEYPFMKRPKFIRIGG